jgi:hypothetical protein
MFISLESTITNRTPFTADDVVALSILEPERALVNLGETSASQVVMVAERCAPSDAIAEKAVVRPKELALEVPGGGRRDRRYLRS